MLLKRREQTWLSLISSVTPLSILDPRFPKYHYPMSDTKLIHLKECRPYRKVSPVSLLPLLVLLPLWSINRMAYVQCMIYQIYIPPFAQELMEAYISFLIYFFLITNELGWAMRSYLAQSHGISICARLPEGGLNLGLPGASPTGRIHSTIGISHWEALTNIFKNNS